MDKNNMKIKRHLGLAIFLTAGSALAQTIPETITIQTAHTSLIYKVDKDGQLMQLYLGKRLAENQVENIQMTKLEAYPMFGKAYVNDPAFRAVHADGNMTTDLKYVKTEVSEPDQNITLTRIQLKDRFYDLSVFLCTKAYRKEDIFEQWTEIVHNEKKEITLYNFSSSHLGLNESAYWLTSFSGNWASEMNMHEEQLSGGIKTIESKLGVRSNQFAHACFLLGVNGPAKENDGTVIGGTLAWPGSWRLA
ncbi:MAG: alpha-galactosidase, partial [Marivirga sp.]|nr:alpha-galactosidase [Marivirga sp.]